MFYKIGALKNFAKLKGKKTVLESLFNKVTYLRSAILLVKTPTQMLSCEFCETFKKPFYRTPSVAAFNNQLLRNTLPFIRLL